MNALLKGGERSHLPIHSFHPPTHPPTNRSVNNPTALSLQSLGAPPTPSTPSKSLLACAWVRTSTHPPTQPLAHSSSFEPPSPPLPNPPTHPPTHSPTHPPNQTALDGVTVLLPTVYDPSSSSTHPPNPQTHSSSFEPPRSPLPTPPTHPPTLLQPWTVSPSSSLLSTTLLSSVPM